MRKVWTLVLLAALLWGCAAPREYETVSDVWVEEEVPEAKRVTVLLPQDAASMTMENDRAEKLYLCDGYCVVLQTLPAGDLDATIRCVTGFERDQLSMIERKDPEGTRYVCAWSAAGETGDQVGRAVILNDGSYHYAVSLMANAEMYGDLMPVWEAIVASVSLNTAP